MKVKILVPESLAEITLEQYQKFLKISEENENSLFLQQKMIEIFCNIELKQVLNIKYNSIVKITNHLNKLFEQKPEFTPTFKRQNLEFGFIPKLDDMTFGEFVDLDTTIADWENIHKAMGVLYRPVTLSKNKKYQIESYESFDKYDMQKMPLDVVLGALFFFLEFKQRINDTYTELFQGGVTESDLSAKANFGRKWGWYSSLYGLSNGDVLKLNKVTRQPLHQCLMFLSFEKDKNETETRILKQKIK